jgi:FkbM family methyltransferase
MGVGLRPLTGRSSGVLAAALARVVYPRFRATPFRGLGRLRRVLPVPSTGVQVAEFPGGMRLRLDMEETIQQDYLFGMYDRLELRLVQRLLADGGDFVDIGAHIGFYTVAAALCGSRVLAFEPHPRARAHLLANLELNATSAEVVPKAVSSTAGGALLRVPETPDMSWASLEQRTFIEGEPLEVEVTTVDDETGERDLRPTLVKIDVEGHELEVLTGMNSTLERSRPVVLCEVGEHTAHEAEASFARRDCRAFRVVGAKLHAGVGGGPGIYNVVFVPEEKVAWLSDRRRD